MRVLHIVDSLVQHPGSVAVVLPGLVRALQAERVDAEIRELARSGVAPDAASDWRAAVAQADVVHIHTWRGERSAAAARQAIESAKPFVITPNGGLNEGPYRRRGWRDKLKSFFGGDRLIRSARALIASNSAEAEALKADKRNDRIDILPYGLDVEGYVGLDQQGAEREAGKYILALGPIHPESGLVPFLKTFAALGRANIGWSVVVAGESRASWRRKLEAGLRRKGAADRVRFEDAADEEQQRSLLHGASLLVAWNLHNGPSIAVMQALASGVPVVATDRVAPDGLNGHVRLLTPDSSDAKDALRGWMQLTDEQRSTMAQQNMELARSCFDWSALARQYADLYADVAR